MIVTDRSYMNNINFLECCGVVKSSWHSSRVLTSEMYVMGFAIPMTTMAIPFSYNWFWTQKACHVSANDNTKGITGG